MLYQLSYASPNNRVSRLKNETLARVPQQVHNCQGYHMAERLRNLVEGLLGARFARAPDAIIPRLMRV
jgi:hypothetical protein